jgi:Kdo2-lipid IVA lauroyltransferase/acyltransferase
MLTLFHWLSRRPLWFLHGIGAALGWLTYWASPTYRRRFHQNVRQAGIEPGSARPAIAAAGRMVAELPFLWLRPAGEPIKPRLEWQGREVLAAALQSGRGVVLMTPHLGSFEVTAQAIAQEFAKTYGPVTALYRPARKAMLREVMERSRARPGVATAPANLAGVRLMIRALRRGEAVALLPDQVPPEGMGVWVPFFGKPAYTMTLAARLIQQTGAVPLLMWGERQSQGAGFVVHFSELGETLPAGDDTQAESATVVNRAMERLIRRCPQQYLWGYNRYKKPRSAGPA